MRRRTLLPVFVFTILLAFISVNSAFGQNWKSLGSKKVNFDLSKDVVQVGLKEGIFTALKIEVGDGAMNMHKIVIQFGNGSTQELPVNHNFGRGKSTKEIDLKGNKRIIRNITFYYDSKKGSGGKATVVIYGR